METLLFAIILVIGFFAGTLTKGVHININTNKKESVSAPSEKPVYNPSTIDELPDEIRSYYDQTKGFNKN
jgi:hypothetical protein